MPSASLSDKPAHEDFRTVVQIFDKSDDSIRLMIGNILGPLHLFYPQSEWSVRIQVCSLMKHCSLPLLQKIWSFQKSPDQGES